MPSRRTTSDDLYVEFHRRPLEPLRNKDEVAYMLKMAGETMKRMQSDARSMPHWPGRLGRGYQAALRQAVVACNLVIGWIGEQAKE